MSKYGYFLKHSRTILSDLLVVVGLVTALTIGDYFTSKASLEHKISYYNLYYDEEEILKVFGELNLRTAQEVYLNLRKRRAIIGNNPFKFGRNNPIDSTNYYMPFELKKKTTELREALKFEFKEKAGDFFEFHSASINNRAFWETTYIDTLLDILDSLSFYNVMTIILAHREVTVLMSVYNNGNLPARDIKIHMNTPFLLSPRSLLTSANVEFLNIRPDYYPVDNKENTSTIFVAYLKQKNFINLYVTTSMTNITDKNIFIEYETEKDLKIARIIIFLLIMLIIYYFVPFVISLIIKQLPKTESSSADKEVGT